MEPEVVKIIINSVTQNSVTQEFSCIECSSSVLNFNYSSAKILYCFYTEWFTWRRPRINNYRSSSNLPIRNKICQHCVIRNAGPVSAFPPVSPHSPESVILSLVLRSNVGLHGWVACLPRTLVLGYTIPSHPQSNVGQLSEFVSALQHHEGASSRTWLENRRLSSPVDTADKAVQDMSSPANSLRQLSQETGMSCSLCERAARNVRIHPTALQLSKESQPLDMHKRVTYWRQFQTFVAQNPDIFTWRGFLM
jgi:hypothetical protein